MTNRRIPTATLTFVAVFVLAIIIIFGQRTVAQSDSEWTVESFLADYYINDSADGSMDIEETIHANFNVERHGIYRYIPSYYDEGFLKPGVDLNTTLKSITNGQDGEPVIYQQDESNGYRNLTIGDPNAYVTGDYIYKIDYSVENAIRFFDNHDELFWDVNGTDWPVGIAQVSARVFVPSNLRGSVINVECWTGVQNSDASNCSISYDENSGVMEVSTDNPLSNNENLSYAMAFEKGVFTPPTFLERWSGFMLRNIGILLPLVVLFTSYRVWTKYGRDPKSRGVIVPQYTPPDDLRPAEMGTVADYNVDDRDISATIIDLAIRGYIQLEDTTASERKKKRKYTFHLLRTDLSELKEYEKEIINGLFSGTKVGSSVEMKSLKDKFYKTTEEVKRQLYTSLVSSGYFASHPKNTENTMRGIGGFLVGAGLFSIFVTEGGFLGWSLGLALSGVVLLILSSWMPKRTVKGVEVWGHAEGLKMYIDLAEKDRLRVMQGADSRYIGDTTAPKYTVELFEKLLPYAIVMGVEESWADKFKNIYSEPPDWYQGKWTTFNTIYLVNTLSRGVNTMNSTLAAPPSSSSSSGFSGGGFSGGGMGGGGGGSW